MQVIVTAIDEISNAPGFRQCAVSVTFADAQGSILHRMDFSTRIEAQLSDSLDLIHQRAVEQTKRLARQFAES